MPEAEAEGSASAHQGGEEEQEEEEEEEEAEGGGERVLPQDAQDRVQVRGKMQSEVGFQKDIESRTLTRVQTVYRTATSSQNRFHSIKIIHCAV